MTSTEIQSQFEQSFAHTLSYLESQGDRGYETNPALASLRRHMPSAEYDLLISTIPELYTGPGTHWAQAAQLYCHALSGTENGSGISYDLTLFFNSQCNCDPCTLETYYQDLLAIAGDAVKSHGVTGVLLAEPGMYGSEYVSHLDPCTYYDCYYLETSGLGREANNQISAYIRGANGGEVFPPWPTILVNLPYC